jgi:hypothetical protein
LPGTIEFAFTDSADHGAFCRETVRIRFVGNNAFWEPKTRVCGRRSQSFPPDQGQIYPVNGTLNDVRNCQVSAGRFPKMSCDNGERKTLRQRQDEPFAMRLTTQSQGSFSGGTLKLATKVVEDRTLADGTKQNVTFTQNYEFRFAPGKCEFRKIKRVRLVDGRDRSSVAMNPGSCRVIG